MIQKRKETLSSNYQKILSEVNQQKLIAVSKYHTFEDIEILYNLGHRDFGESRVQDLKIKSQKARDTGLSEIRWHFIGHLQSKKAKDLLNVENLVAIHSIDSLKIFEQLNKRVQLLKKPLSLFLQVNTSAEKEKSGIEGIDQLDSLMEQIHKVEPLLPIEGLMTIGRVRTDQFEEDAKLSFSQLLEYKKFLDKKYETDLKLSMGMSSDFRWALEYGSDYVRVGSALFSEG